MVQSCIQITSSRTGIEITTLVVICSDCTGNCKFNYHTIMTTTIMTTTTQVQICNILYTNYIFFWVYHTAVGFMFNYAIISYHHKCLESVSICGWTTRNTANIGRQSRMNNQKHCQHWTAIKNEQPETLPTLDDNQEWTTRNTANIGRQSRMNNKKHCQHWTQDTKQRQSKKDRKARKRKTVLASIKRFVMFLKVKFGKSLVGERGKINIGPCNLQFVCSWLSYSDFNQPKTWVYPFWNHCISELALI
jgi:hypothetical protein